MSVGYELRFGWTEPVMLRVLAEFLRDGTWLDMRIDEERVNRVKIIEISVHKTGESVVVKQNYMKGDNYCSDRLVFDAERIWSCKPTEVELLDVEPFEPEPVIGIAPHRPSETIDEYTQRIVDAVLVACVHLYPGISVATLIEPNSDYKEIHYRHQCIIAIYEMTDLTQGAICKQVFNYASPTPWVSARYKADSKYDSGKQAEGFKHGVRQIAQVAEKYLDTGKLRRQAAFPFDYKQVLR